MINVSGLVQNIDVTYSVLDGVDLDFSEVFIENIKIKNSGNDCIDFSGGKYRITSFDLINCGDKGLSVGEKSNLKLEDVIINQAKTGIAVKDSSIVTANRLLIKKTTKCLDVFRKKQEFSGGILNLNHLSCETGRINRQPGSFINHQI